MGEESVGTIEPIAAGPRRDPVVRTISVADVNQAWAQGLRDFRAAPAYGLVFGGLCAVAGLVIILGAIALDLGYLAYPLTAGFAFVGPFVAVGLYEVSRRREANMALTWSTVLGAVFAPRNRQLAWMGLLILFFFIVWIYQVQLLVALFLGTHSFSSLHEFLIALTSTSEGIIFLLLGNAIGALLSIALFSVTFVSLPLLLDRDIDFVSAVITSVRAVVANPLAAIGWAITITLLLILASLPFFLGLVVVLPILAHTSWHLYRRIVAPEPFASLNPYTR